MVQKIDGLSFLKNSCQITFANEFDLYFVLRVYKKEEIIQRFWNCALVETRNTKQDFLSNQIDP